MDVMKGLAKAVETHMEGLVRGLSGQSVPPNLPLTARGSGQIPAAAAAAAAVAPANAAAEEGNVAVSRRSIFFKMMSSHLWTLSSKKRVTPNAPADATGRDVPFNDANGMYNMFLEFTAPDLRRRRLEYLWFKRSDSNLILKVAVLAVFVGFGASLFRAHEVATTAPYLAALIAAFVALVFMLANIVLTLGLLAMGKDEDGDGDGDDPPRCLGFVCQRVRGVLNKPSGQVIEDSVVIFGQLAMSLFQFADSLRARNDATDRQLLPPDLTVAAMVMVLLAQVFSNGASRTALLVAWGTSIAFTNASLYMVRSDLYWWIDACYFFLLGTSYELERRSLRHFIKSLLAVEASKFTADLQLKLAEQQIREGEQTLAARTSIVRHVGHEIRTPLNTIAIAGDILVQELAAIPQVRGRNKTTSFQRRHPPPAFNKSTLYYTRVHCAGPRHVIGHRGRRARSLFFRA